LATRKHPTPAPLVQVDTVNGVPCSRRVLRELARLGPGQGREARGTVDGVEVVWTTWAWGRRCALHDPPHGRPHAPPSRSCRCPSCSAPPSPARWPTGRPHWFQPVAEGTEPLGHRRRDVGQAQHTSVLTTARASNRKLVRECTVRVPSIQRTP
jgi:hypothetical protein